MTTAIEYALLAGAAYFSTRDAINRFPVPAGWIEDIAQRNADDQTGFEARAFQKGTEIVISYSGTDPNAAGLFSKDMQANLQIIRGDWTAQLQQAAEYYLEIKAANPAATITLTGHSLGGGLASLVGVFFGVGAQTFDQAPFAKSATALSDNANALLSVLTAKRDASDNRVFSDAVLAPLTEFLQLRGPSNPIPRSNLVNTIQVEGEVLHASLIGKVYDRIGNTPVSLSNGQTTDKTNLHSQSLLTAFLQSEKTAPSGQAFNDATKTLTSLLPLLFDEKLYSTNVASEQRNFLDHLVRNETGGIGGIAVGGNALLTHFAADLQKLGANIAGPNVQAQNALIAQGIEWYYWQGTGYSGQKFFTQTGKLFQYTTAIGAGLTGAQDKAGAYVKLWIDPLSKAHGASGVQTTYQQWSVNTGTEAVTATAVDATKSQIFIGGTGADTFTGGNKDDVMLAGAGNDTLTGGGGDDKLYGGGDDDTYHFNGTWGKDTVTDSDGKGAFQMDGKALTNFGGAGEREGYSFDMGGNVYANLDIQKSGNTYKATITKGTDTANTITINNFDLSKAKGEQGYMGIKLGPAKVALTQESGNYWSVPGATLDSLSGKTVTVAEGGGTSFGLNLSSGAKANDTITLSFAGANGKVILGDTTVDANGAVITLTEGQTQARFSLVHDGELDADAVASLSATYNSSGTSATSNTWAVTLRDSGEADNTFNGDYVVVTEKHTGAPIKRTNTEGVQVTVVETNELKYEPDAQGNLKAGTTDPTQRPIYNEQGEVIGMETIPSDDQMVTDNTLYGTPGNDKINGLAGNDLLAGKAGNDQIDGGAGNDMIGGGAGNDNIKGGDGNDYISSSADVHGGYQQLGPNDNWASWGLPAGKTLQAGGTMWGAYPGDDARVVVWNGVSSTPTEVQSDAIDAGAGDDWVMGSWGNDRIKGGDGKDQLDGLAGDDIVVGDAGDDILDGDGLLKSGFLNTVQGASHGSDFLDGGAGNDELIGGGREDNLFGGVGNDKLFSDTPSESDSPYFLALDFHGADYLDGEDGDDYMEGGGGADVLYGGNGADNLYGDTPASKLKGAAATDPLASGDDYLDGEAGNDNLMGGGGLDVLYGGDGDDYLDGGQGADYMDGGAGSDTYVIDSENDVVVEAASPTGGGSPMTASLALTAMTPMTSGDDIDAIQAHISYTLGDGFEQLTLVGSAAINGTGNAADNSIVGNSAANVLTAAGGSDWLSGGGGDDVYVFSRGDGGDTVSNTDFLRDTADPLLQQAVDTVRFGDGIAVTDVSVRRQGDNLVLQLKGTDDYVFVANHYGAQVEVANSTRVLDHKIDRLVFADGTVWDQARIELEADRSASNHAPVFNASIPLQQARVGSAFSYTVPAGTATDPDAWDAVTYSIKRADGTALPDWLTFDAATGTLSGTPDATDVGSPQLKLWATDTYGSAVGRNFWLQIDPPNQVPVIIGTVPAKLYARAGVAFNYTVPAGTIVDLDGADTLTYSVSQADGSPLPQWLTFNAATRTLAGLASVEDAGSLQLVLCGTDNHGGTASHSITMAVALDNLAPMVQTPIADQQYSAGESFSFSLPAGTFNDPDASGTLIYAATLADGSALPSWLAFNAQTRVFKGNTRTPAQLSVRVTATDAEGASESDVFELVVPQPVVTTISGTPGVDRLNGDDGPNILIGGTGDDKLFGGAGNDIYVFNRGDGSDAIGNQDLLRDDADPTVTQAIDTLRLGAGIAPQDLVLQRYTSDMLPQFVTSDLIIRIRGTADEITVHAHFNDATRWTTLWYDRKLDQLEFADGTVWDATKLAAEAERGGPLLTDRVQTGTDDDDYLYGNLPHESLRGLGGNDYLLGTGSKDLLDGGAGNDQLSGGAGNDDYVFGKGWGTDRIQEWTVATNEWAVSRDNRIYLREGVTPDEVKLIRAQVPGEDGSLVLLIETTGESLEINGFFDAQGVATFSRIQFADAALTTWTLPDIVARAGASVTGAADTQTSTAADNTFLVDNTADKIIEAAGGGNDTVRSTVNYTLPANVENLELASLAREGKGNSLNNVLRGNTFSNRLEGMGGLDTYEGGAGDDIYIDMADRSRVAGQAMVIEREGEGHDVLVTNMASVDMADHLEDLLISEAIYAPVATDDYEHYYTGNELDNLIDLSFAQFGNGPQGPVRIRVDGGEGADHLRGPSLNWTSLTFVVDDMDDRFEIRRPGDYEIETSLSYTLPEEITRLRLTGSDTVSATGNDWDNELDGTHNAGANRLTGMNGNDTYLADLGDVVVEAAGGGLDTVVLHAGGDAAPDMVRLGDFAHVEALQLAADMGDAALQGTAGADRLTGNAGDNRIEGLAGNDTLVGGGGRDELLGGAGNDAIHLGAGFAVVDGGTGNDSVAAGGAQLQIRLAADGGADTVSGAATRTAAQWAAQRDIQSLVALTESADASALRFTRAAKDLTIKLGTASLTLQNYFKNAQSEEAVSALDAIRLGDGTYLTRDAIAAGLGQANLQAGGAGDDLLITSAAVRTLAGGAGSDHLFGQGTADTLDGGAGNDRLHGGNGNDQLKGGAGNDVLAGGRGADAYQYAAGWGQDVVDDLQRSERQTDTDDALDDDEALNTIQFDATVTAASITLQRSGNDLLLRHKTTADVIRVQAYFEPQEGNGLFQVRFAGGTVWNAAYIDQQVNTVTGTAGNDTLTALAGGGDVVGLAGADRLTGRGGNDRLYGGAGADTLAGAGGDDLLDGGKGADAMAGGLGNDTYVADSTGDSVTEQAGSGQDTVRSSISWVLGANVEDLTLTGAAAINATGNALDNTLTGNAAANVLDGKGGDDVMAGGAGNDTYIVAQANDTTVELANGGVDTVKAGISWALAANVEHLTLTGAGAINGTGNALANVIQGNAAANVLNGGAGADTLQGGAGNDTYVVDHTGDTVTELAAQGTDQVNAYVNWVLGAHLENLTLLGTAALNGTGNALNNVLTGNAGANTLTGGLGADTLDGKAGADILKGGAGNDIYWLGRGHGADTLVEADATAGNRDVLRFAADVTANQLWFRKLGNNLEISIIGTADRMTVQNWYLGAQYRVEEFVAGNGKTLDYAKVQTLVNAMDDLAIPVMGQPNLPPAYGAHLNAVLASAWS